MGKRSRDKGKVGEREARDMVRKLWGSPECQRSAQACGSFTADLLGGPPGLHLEVKRYARIVPADWVQQATEDSKKSGDVPVVLCREDRGEWNVIIPMEQAEEFARALIEHLGTAFQRPPA